MRRSVTLLLLMLACLVSAGCDSEPQVGDTIGSPDDPVVMLQGDEPEMAAAVAEARSTVSDFIAALQNPPEGASSFAVKKKFTDGDQTEYMWLIEPTYADGVFTGTLDNDPQLVTNVQIGQQYSVKETEIQDWLYFAGEEMQGAYSVKVLMKMSE